MNNSSTKLYNVLMGNTNNGYNAIGRSAGMKAANQDNPNFFQKRWNSIENALGTTGAAVASAIKSGGILGLKGVENVDTENMLKRQKASLEDIYKKYGYNDANAYYDAKDSAENDIFGRYGYNANDFWDKRAAADLAGNKDEVARLEKERQDVIGRMNAEDADRINYFDNIQNELKGQAGANAQEATDRAKAYEDYRKNNYISQKINQDRGKFAGSAINTLSTASDVLGLSNGPLSNAIQGGIEGIADELEQNGLENFDWNRAGQNAAIGAASGAVTGAFNKGLNNTIASNGGKLFKGNNFLTRGVNKVVDFSSGAKSLPGQVLESIGQGAVRGAASGAVGGATGAGLSAAMNNQDVLGSALQGAVQGAQQGFTTGGIMGGVNTAINRTPGVGKFLQDVNQAQQDWKNSGENFDERLTNTFNSGDSAIGNWLNRRTQSNALASIGNIGNSIADVTPTDNGLDAWDRLAQQKGYNNYNEVIEKFIEANPDVQLNPRGAAGQILTWLDQNPNTPTTAGGWLKRAGERIVEDANNRGVGLSIKDVSDEAAANDLARTGGVIGQPQADTWDRVAQDFGYSDYDNVVKAFIQANPNAKVDADSVLTWLDNNPGELSANTTQLTGGKTQPKLAYGESQLGNRTKRGMIADAIERLGNTLEGAQANVGTPAAKDLGIESTGKVIENVRKKTGLTNLETQAAFAKELTGGQDSLMDNIQRRALSTSPDGKGFKVNTDEILNHVDSIVDEEIPLSVFGSQSARDKFVSNLKRDVSSYDRDVISNSNKLKSVAADLRGKGVVDPPALDKAKSKVYTRIANELDDLSYKAIPQKNVNDMFDTTIREMRGRAIQAESNGNNDAARAYNTAADKLDAEPRTISAYRSFKKDFVDTAKVNEITQRAENGAAMQMGRGFGGAVKRFTGTLLQRPANAALAKIGGVANSLADKIAGDGTPNPTNTTPTPTSQPTNAGVIEAAYNPSTQIYNAIGRTEGLTNGEQARTANYLTNAVQNTNTVPNTGATTLEALMAPGNASATSVYNSVYGTPNATAAQATNTGYFQPTGDYWTDILANAVSAAIDANDATAFASLYGMYQDAVSKNQSNSTSQQKLSSTQQRANAAMNSLERLSGMTPDFAYNLSNIPVIGNIATWGGNDYEAEAKSLAQQIGYMVSGSNIKDSEAESIGKSYVPQPWDNETVRKNKLRRAYEIIQQYQNGYAE